jgi:hydrogenase maturation protease
MTIVQAPLVIGIGNVLLRDEGVGVAVARRVEAARAAGDPIIPGSTRVVDGGTLGLDLLPMLEDADTVVLVDAVDLQAAPGSVTILRDLDVQAALSGHVSPHQVGVGDLVATARLLGKLPRRLALVGIQPLDISIGLELSPPVEAAVGPAVAAVGAELAGG